MSPAAKQLIIGDANDAPVYSIIGKDICMGDHKVKQKQQQERLFICFIVSRLNARTYDDDCGFDSFELSVSSSTIDDNCCEARFCILYQ